MQWPLALLGFTGMMLDNPWSLVMDRAEKCGVLLADVLIQVCFLFFCFLFFSFLL